MSAILEGVTHRSIWRCVMTNRERLEAIDVLLGEILATLDTSSSVCPGCGGTKYHVYGDHNIAERFKATRAKWRKLAQSQAEWVERA